jgi:DNA-binding response OmpR family regulator
MASDAQTPSPLVLVLDDEPAVIRMMSLELKVQGYRVASALIGEDAYRAIEEHTPAVVVLEVMLPGGTGFDVLKEIKRRYDVPVVFITSVDNDADRAYALELGADDYIRKPFVPLEMVQRLAAIMQGGDQPGTRGVIRRAGDLEVDLSRNMVRRGGVVIALTTNEWAILYRVSSEPDRAVSSEVILREVFGDVYAQEFDYLDIWMRRLRNKIEPNPSAPRVIVGDSERGYMLVTEEQ